MIENNGPERDILLNRSLLLLLLFSLPIHFLLLMLMISPGKKVFYLVHELYSLGVYMYYIGSITWQFAATSFPLIYSPYSFISSLKLVNTEPHKFVSVT